MFHNDDSVKLHYEFGGKYLGSVSFSIEVPASALKFSDDKHYIAEFTALAALAMRKEVADEEYFERQRREQLKRTHEDDGTPPPNPAKRARSAKAEDSVSITMGRADGSALLEFHMTPRSKLQRALVQYAERYGETIENLRVYLNGREVKIDESIESLGVEDGARFNVMTRVR